MGGGRRGTGREAGGGGGVKDRRPVLLPNDGTIHRCWLDLQQGGHSHDHHTEGSREGATGDLLVGDGEEGSGEARLLRSVRREAICILQAALREEGRGKEDEGGGRAGLLGGDATTASSTDDFVRRNDDGNDSSAEDDEEGASSVWLVRSLVGASSLPEQLRILQAFRSRVLLRRRTRPTRQEGEGIDVDRSHEGDGDGVDNSKCSNTKGSTSFVSLYYLLLEWCLSSGTPVPLRRAVRGVLCSLDRWSEAHPEQQHHIQPQRTAHGRTTEGAAASWAGAVVHGIVASIVENAPREPPRQAPAGGPPARECGGAATTATWRNPTHTVGELLDYVGARHGTGGAEGLEWATLVNPLWTCLERGSRPVHERITNAASKDARTEAATTMTTTTWDGDLLRAIDDGIELCQLCQQLIVCGEMEKQVGVGVGVVSLPASGTGDFVATAAKQLAQLHWSLLTCPALPLEKLLLVGIATVRIEVFWKRCTEAHRLGPLDRPPRSACPHLLDRAGLTHRDAAGDAPKPPPQVRAALLNGIATCCASRDLFVAVAPCGSSDDVEPGGAGAPLADRVLRQLCMWTHAADVDVRFLAFKGLRTLTSRYAKLNEETGIEIAERVQFQDRVLNVVLDAWENPSGSRKVETAILPLFCQLLAFGPTVDANESEESSASARLVHRILEQPKHTKGRYLALHALLKAPTNKRMASQLFSRELCEDLLTGIGEGGHNTLVMADLLSLLLRQLLEDLRDIARTEARDAPLVGPDGLRILSSWFDRWVPAFVASLVSGDRGSRRHIASFCFPRIIASVGGAAHRFEAALTMVRVLSECCAVEEGYGSGRSDRLSVALSSRDETLADRALWVQLKVACSAFHEGLLKDSDLGLPSRQLVDALARALSSQRLQSALVHFSASIRDAAFEAIEAVAFCASHSALGHECNATEDPLTQLKLEFDLWTFALPYSQKLCGKESTTIILHRLLAFLDRLSRQAETLSLLRAPESAISEEPLLLAFSSFLLNDLFVKRGCYPGSTLEKEMFSLGMIEGLLVYLFRNNSVARASKLVPKTGTLFQRRRGSMEASLLSSVEGELMSDNVFRALLTLMHSIWDNTRSTAFEVLSNAVVLRRKAALDLPNVLSDKRSLRDLEIRSVHLASSPRQREADSGGRLLAILFLSSTDQDAFLSRLLALLANRLTSAAELLGTILSGETDVASQLPLAHGLVHAVRLIVSRCNTYGQPCDDDHALTLVKVVFRSLRLSLTVVADLRKSGPNGLDEDCVLADGCIENESRLVSAGAIGANLAFSSVQHASARDVARRLAYQRLIVGAWLLTKESCHTISTVFSAKECIASPPLLKEAGDLLLDTLATLKHAGAVFGSHKALQDLTVVCLGHASPAIQGLPSAWVSQLLVDVGGLDGAKSFLRRSTGLSLGFLSIMRAEAAMRVSPRPLCRQVITSLLSYTLPPDSQLRTLLASISLTQKDLATHFCFLGGASLATVSGGDSASRIHAFNVLRAAFLDSPLAPDVFPYAGDAIAVAVLGYLDPLWAVRNSATMLYSSVMLRVIDSNKNAWDVKATTSRAISLSELFRSFPSLPQFLRLMLDAAASGCLLNHHSTRSIPPEFPILLLLCRVQPMPASGSESEAMVALLWTSIRTSLRHRSVLVRRTAARTLSNLAFDVDESTLYSSRKLVNWCLETCPHCGDWNYFHGIMLTLRHVLVDRKNNTIDEGTRRGVHSFLGGFFNRPMEKLPPPCLSVALEIALASDFNGLLKTASQIQCMVELMTERGVYGMAELGSAVGSVTTKHLSSKLWNSGVSATDFLALLELQGAVLCSTSFDVRHAAVKAFKKEFSKGVDRICENPSAEANLKFEALFSLLSQCLIRELHSNALIGSHVPTLRRLSRCLIEARMANREGKSNGLDEVTLGIVPILEEYIRESGEERDDTLAGNFLELLSLALCGRTDVESDTRALFQNLVIRFGHPSEPWRLRLSAAAALQLSNVLGRPQDLAKRAHQIFLQLALRLAQDNDVDVRRTATQGLLSSAASPPSPPASLNVGCHPSLPVPEHVFRSANLSDVALQLAWEHTKGLDGCMSQAIDELQSITMDVRSCGTSEIPDLRNASSDRLIFEEESVSRYMEPCLLVQRSLSDLVQNHRRPKKLEFWTAQEIDLARKIVFRCSHALLDLVDVYRRYGQDGGGGHLLLYDVTQESSVLPQLHSVLLAVAAFSLVGLIDDAETNGTAAASAPSKLQRLALELLDLSQSTQPLNPLVHEALRLVATSGDEGLQEDETFARFHRACFLMS